MELKEYLALGRRWAWLLILGLIWGAAGGFFGSRYQTPIYQTSTRLLVMRAPQEKSSDYTYLSDQQLVQTYIQLATTQPVLDAVITELGYPVNRKQITIQQIRDTQVMQLAIDDENPERAAAIANTLVEQLIKQNERLQSSHFVSTEESIQAQITQVEDQINSLQLQLDHLSTQSFEDQVAQVETQIKPLEQEVSTLQQEIAGLEATVSSEQAKRYPDEALILANKTQAAEKQARIEQIQPLLNLYQEIYSNLVVLGKPVDSGSNSDSRITRLQATLDLYQSLYINLLSSLETVRLARLQNTPNVVQIERAPTPVAPIRPRPWQNTALAAAVGLLLASGLAFLIEYLDDTLRSPEEVERVLGVPALGFVAEINYKKNSTEGVHVSRQPRSPVAEAFRTLRTNIEFASTAKVIRTILVTSSGPEEGKTTVAVNLAAIMALSGKKVVLLDADMRRPRVHRLLGVPNRGGLSRLFHDPERLDTVVRTPVEPPNLKVITSGSRPPNPAELLGSEQMSQILSHLTRFADLVVIDTPPSLVADAQILAGKVDAVLFVIVPGKTKAATAAAALELFKRAGARVIGTVLNRIPHRRDYYYGNYSYYSPSRYKNYYVEPVVEPAKSQAVRTKPLEPESALTYSFLQTVARLPQQLEEIPPPNPREK